MARIEWVAARLSNWALWKEREMAGGLGYATQSIFADGPAARGNGWYGENRIPCDEIDASITDEAVESLRLGHGHLYKTLHLFYVRGQGIKGTARAMDRAESTIHHQLGQADALIATWFDERKRRIATRGLVAADASLSIRDVQQSSSAALEIHDARREVVREERKAARQATKGQKRRESVRTSAIETTPTGPRIARRPVLTLKGKAQ